MALAEAEADHAGGERGVMTDVQVSNARRIGFTALALVSFWVLAWREYSIACSDVYQNAILLGVFASGLQGRVETFDGWHPILESHPIRIPRHHPERNQRQSREPNPPRVAHL